MSFSPGRINIIFSRLTCSWKLSHYKRRGGVDLLFSFPLACGEGMCTWWPSWAVHRRAMSLGWLRNQVAGAVALQGLMDQGCSASLGTASLHAITAKRNKFPSYLTHCYLKSLLHGMGRKYIYINNTSMYFQTVINSMKQGSKESDLRKIKEDVTHSVIIKRKLTYCPWSARHYFGC